ncbi:sugar transporter ERD6-like 14 [Lathyrus oleraceus]|uniref:sugar transporter ERD6-like 14 n=1 Tax=Pisum sativum TaxID=3888 RepID=UPI0021D0DD00|nr:sugar transporter ERD6-like 14 [Pisum sativum]
MAFWTRYGNNWYKSEVSGQNRYISFLAYSEVCIDFDADYDSIGFVEELIKVAEVKVWETSIVDIGLELHLPHKDTGSTILEMDFVGSVGSVTVHTRVTVITLVTVQTAIELSSGDGHNVLTGWSSPDPNQTHVSSDVATFGVGAVQVLATILTLWLADKSGRRLLLIVSSSAMALSLLVVSISFYLKEYISPDSDLYTTLSLVSVAGVVVMVIAFSLGLGAMPWIIMSEILPINIKGLAGSFATLANWFFSWLVTLTANLLLDWSSGGSFPEKPADVITTNSEKQIESTKESNNEETSGEKIVVIEKDPPTPPKREVVEEVEKEAPCVVPPPYK